MILSNQKHNFLFALLLLCTVWQSSAQKLSAGVFGGVNNPELFFEWINPVNVVPDSANADQKWNVFHYGITGKYQLYKGLYVRTDMYFMQTESDFVATYKVRDTEWLTDASFKQNTFHWMIAPQLHFLPKNLAYVYGGFMYEINRGSDFTRGTFTVPQPDGSVTNNSFADDEAKNTTNPTAVVGLGIHPRFNKFGVMLDARYSRSRAEAVHEFVPRIGRENISFSFGLTYDIID